MSQSTGFPSSTPRHQLPFLFAGQAQKEFFVNEALARIDMLLNPVVEGVLSVPPGEPVSGACYIVGEQPADEWTGFADAIAGWIDGQWTFASPSPGLAVHERSSGTSLIYSNGWQRLEAPTPPSGGDVVDAQARTAIEELVALLTQRGLFA